MEMATRVGCSGLAAPPVGLTSRTDVSLLDLAERYADLIDLGCEHGVVPILEFWGMSKTLGRLGEAMLVAAESGRREAGILADVFHMYKGTGHHHGLTLIGSSTLALVHVNDYPADPPRIRIGDGDRVYPGDGVAPLQQILRDLKERGYRGMLSLELFNAAYWERTPKEVAATGLAKMKEAVEGALG
jgi:sugar phosphate isomerase/epimerase